MRSAMSRSRSTRRGVSVIWITLLLCTVLLPMVGLAIDLTVVYSVQSNSSAAVDAGALGAGRLLSTVTDSNTIQTIATQFVNANFPAGYFGSGAPQITATYTPGFTQTVQVSATVQVPLIFMRALGFKMSTAGRYRHGDSQIQPRRDRARSLGLDGP